jgi:VanZ family protein
MLTAHRENLYWQLPAWLWGCIILILTSLPSLKPPSLGIEIEDKVYHLLVYFLLGLLIARAYIRGNRENIRYGTIRMLRLGIPLAILDEVHQAFIPGRFCDSFDALADILGLLLAILIMRLAGDAITRKDRSIYCIFSKCDAIEP